MQAFSKKKQIRGERKGLNDTNGTTGPSKDARQGMDHNKNRKKKIAQAAAVTGNATPSTPDLDGYSAASSQRKANPPHTMTYLRAFCFGAITMKVFSAEPPRPFDRASKGVDELRGDSASDHGSDRALRRRAAGVGSAGK